MKRAILIGKFDETARGIASSLAGEFQVLPCCDEQDLIGEMLKTEVPDLIIVYLSGSAVAARDMFAFLRQYRYPLLGIGPDDNQAELFINGYLSDSQTRFLNKPAAAADILRCAKELCSGEDAGDGDAQPGNAKAAIGGRYDGAQPGKGYGGLSGSISQPTGRFSGGGKESGVQTGADLREEIEAQGEQAVILVVDDNPGFVRAMQAVLSKRYRVIFATSAVQCIIAADKYKPDLILLDYEMPVCDGKLTLQMLRSEKVLKEIPVVFLTGKSDAKRVSDVMALHPQGYLLKPCAEDVVFSTIEQVLKGKAGNK